MPRPRPVTDADRAEILRRHAAGESRNSIAKALTRSGETVSKVVAAEGGSFARAPEVAAATEARLTDLASRRAQLADDLLADAEKLRTRLWSPTKVYSFGGKDNTYEEQAVNEPPPSDKRALMATLSVAVDKSLRLAPPVDDTGAEAAKSMLGALAAGIRSIVGTDPNPSEEDSGEG